MALNRDLYYQALFLRLKDRVRGIEFFSRHYADYTQVQTQPALICVASYNRDEGGIGYPSKWILGATIVIYAKNPKQDDPGETVLLNLIDNVESALEIGGDVAREMGEAQTTLGGLVYRVSVSGTIEIYPGAEGEQGVALIPVEMIATP